MEVAAQTALRWCLAYTSGDGAMVLPIRHWLASPICHPFAHFQELLILGKGGIQVMLFSNMALQRGGRQSYATHIALHLMFLPLCVSIKAQPWTLYATDKIWDRIKPDTHIMALVFRVLVSRPQLSNWISMHCSRAGGMADSECIINIEEGKQMTQLPSQIPLGCLLPTKCHCHAPTTASTMRLYGLSESMPFWAMPFLSSKCLQST